MNEFTDDINNELFETNLQAGPCRKLIAKSEQSRKRGESISTRVQIMHFIRTCKVKQLGRCSAFH